MILFRVILVLLLFTSCANKIERKKIIGRYVWNDDRIDTLEVRADGTYEYWTFLPGRKLTNSGTWKWDSLTNMVEFERENFPFLKSHVSEGSWFSQLRSNGDEIHLMNGIDKNMYLRKIDALEK